MKKTIFLIVLIAVIAAGDVWLYIHWKSGQLKMPVFCQQDSDCKVIYSSCSCEIVPSSDPRERLEIPTEPLCEINMCRYNHTACSGGHCVFVKFQTKPTQEKTASITPEQAKEALAAYQTEHPDVRLQIFWNKETGFPNSISGYPLYPSNFDPNIIQQLSAQTISVDADLAKSLSNAMLLEIKDILGINMQDLTKPSVHEFKGTTNIVYGQNYSGILVYTSSVHFMLDERGRAQIIESTYFPGISVDVTPQITQEQAIDLARQTAPENIRATLKPQPFGGRYLFVLPKGNGVVKVDVDHLVYVFFLNSTGDGFPYGNMFIVDAHDGAILLSRSTIIQM